MLVTADLFRKSPYDNIICVCLALLVFTEASFPCRLGKSEQWQTARYFNALMTV